jgi:TRAP-type C4-dicarboxylate transport system substrate-binding protein
MHQSKQTNRVAALALAAGMMTALWVPQASAQDKTFTMKLSTATINDTQHAWLKRFAAMVEKDSGGRIKAEIYPASQLGSIPRQIEGVQFGSIQGWMGPPEFLVGVDERYEASSAPGLFSSTEQVVPTILDPAARKLMYDIGIPKGIVGVGFAPIGPSSILSKKKIAKLADLSGMKIRVLASPFQLELIRRMGASPIAMTLGDVAPALQQGTIDGTLTTVSVDTTMKYHDIGKFILQSGQPYVNSLGVMSKKWMDTLPDDLQKIIKDDAEKVTLGITPYVKEFFVSQEKVFTESGGTFTNLPADEFAALNTKTHSIGDDMSKTKPGLNEAVKVMFEAAERHKK